MKELLSKAETNLALKNYTEALRIYKKITRLHPGTKLLFQEIITTCENKILENDVKSKTKINTEKNTENYEIFNFNNDESCAAIITVWKRSDYLKEQLEALKNQTKEVTSILIIQNENHFEISKDLIKEYNLNVIKSSINSLYTRWIIGYLLNEKYIYVLDDDVIPGEKWVEISINALNKYNALVGPSGRRIALTNTPAWKSIETYNGLDQACDWVCNSYFFKREWIQYITAAERYMRTHKTFDDIQLATTLKIFGGINCVVPGQSKKNLEINGHKKREYGHDDNALWKRSNDEHMNARKVFLESINTNNYKWI